MDPWKPTALVLAGALVLMVGYDVASASTGPFGGCPQTHGTQPPVPAPGYHRMEMALMHLREGRNLLENAEHDHGGWKERAIMHADQAIHETERALEWAER